MLLWREAPLLSMQLLWINLVTDSLPAIALGMEPVESDVMNRRPRRRRENIFANGLGVQVLLQGMLFSALTHGIHYRTHDRRYSDRTYHGFSCAFTDSGGTFIQYAFQSFPVQNRPVHQQNPHSGRGCVVRDDSSCFVCAASGDHPI